MDTGDAPESGPPLDDPVERRRYPRDTQEFDRLANLSDAIFGIAMTLLVFTLNDGEVPLDRIGSAIVDQRGELIAFVISFALIANFWWIHHQLFSRLAFVEPGLVVVNLVLLGAVALVPYPTRLLGLDPTAGAAVVPYLGLMNVISILHLVLLVRANSTGAWSRPLPAIVFRWVLAVWGSSTAVTLIAFGVAFVWPVVGLVVALSSWIVSTAIERRAPAAYSAWA